MRQGQSECRNCPRPHELALCQVGGRRLTRLLTTSPPKSRHFQRDTKPLRDRERRAMTPDSTTASGGYVPRTADALHLERHRRAILGQIGARADCTCRSLGTNNYSSRCGISDAGHVALSAGSVRGDNATRLASLLQLRAPTRLYPTTDAERTRSLGKITTTVVPTPSSLWSVSSPPCRLIIVSAIGRPNPVPE